MTIAIRFIGGDQQAEKRQLLIDCLKEQAIVAVDSGEDVVVILHTDTDLSDDATEFINQPAENRAQWINVLLQKVVVPDAFQRGATFDLSQWRGAAENEHFTALVQRLKKMQPTAFADKSGRWISYIKHHKVGVAITTFCIFVIVSFFSNLLEVDRLCSINFVQPGLSDMCGKFGLGDKPGRKERIAWEALDKNSCPALQAHAREFKDGAYRTTAIDLFHAGEMKNQTSWMPETLKFALFETDPEAGSATKSEAMENTRQIANLQAESMCVAHATNIPSRSVSASVEEDKLTCTQTETAHFCNLAGQAVCKLERKKVEQVRVCSTN